MGDFTWHTSDPDHFLVHMGSSAHLPAPFNTPVYLLASDGRKWREDDYEGYGVFGGVESGAELSRWNFPESKTAGKDEDELHGMSVPLSLAPYGRPYSHDLVEFPLKFTRNPEATYDELPASIPAGPEVKYLSLSHFDIHLADGSVVDTEEDREKFWCDLAVKLNLFEGEDPGEDMYSWVSDIFLDAPNDLVLPAGATLVYVGWRESVHSLLSEMVLPRTGWDNPSPEEVREVLDADTITRLADLFDAAVERGRADYDALAAEQIALYEAGQPLTAGQYARFLPNLDMDLRMQRDYPQDDFDLGEKVMLAGRLAGVAAQCAEAMDAFFGRTVVNPFRLS